MAIEGLFIRIGVHVRCKQKSNKALRIIEVTVGFLNSPARAHQAISMFVCFSQREKNHILKITCT